MGEIKLNTKYSIGETVYTVRQTNLKEECEYCKSTGKLNIDGLELVCPNCGGKGHVETNKKKMYVVCDDLATVRSIRIDIKEDNINYRYQVFCGTSRYKRANDTLFSTKEDAEKYCIMMNRPKKQVCIDDIVIKEEFKNTNPNILKIKSKLDYYNAHGGKFDKKIVINKQNELIDGYITYMIAKMYDKQMVECYVE